jgi:hypothetical protein
MAEKACVAENCYLPIEVFISYPWSKDDDDGHLVGIRKDPRWLSIRDRIAGVVQETEKLCNSRKKGLNALDIRIRRLRGRHGQFLLHTLRERISRGDVLIMDIGDSSGSGLNWNVLIEVGMAIGLDKIATASLFILKPVGVALPSDLKGFLYTEYRLDRGGVKLLDDAGFRASLRSTLKDLALARSMIGPAVKAEVEIEQDLGGMPGSKKDSGKDSTRS